MGESGVSERYLGSAGKEYADWQLGAGGMAPEKARRFAPFVTPSDTVLDFGCGGGTLLASLACGERLGVEPNPVSRESCSKFDITVFASLDEAPESSVDVIISNHALEHCLSPIAELQAMRPLLREGGRIVFVLPMEEWRREPKYRTNDINHHLFTWTPLTLGNLFAEAGYEVESVDVIRKAWPPGAQTMWDHLPEKLFDLACTVWSTMVRMPQVRIVAHQ